jgi:hypothetical protein
MKNDKGEVFKNFTLRIFSKGWNISNESSER